MTGDLVLDLAISLGGVLAIVGVTAALGALTTARVTQDCARDRLAFDEPDFVAAEWMIGLDGRAAAAISADRAETALIFAVGDGLATRRFRAGAVALEKAGATLVFRLGEPSLPAVRLAAPDDATAADWLSRIGGPRL